MNVENNGQAQSKSCISCKTFYGKEETQWMCSVCYKKKNGDMPVKAEKKVDEVKVDKKLTVVQPIVEPIKQADKTKCYCCSKKLGIYGVECKCKLVFCNLHRIPEDHNCTVDYKQLGKEKLAKEVKKVVAKKLQEM